MKIICGDDWYVSQLDSTVTGTIFFQEREWCFPYEGYSDFPITCITSWIENICNVIQNPSGKPGSVYLFFFDGPQMINLQIDVLSDSAQMEFYNENDIQNGSVVGEDLVAEKKMGLQQLLLILLTASKTISEIAKSKGLNQTQLMFDIEKLEEFVK